MPVLAKFHVFPVCIVMLRSKLIFSYNFTVYVFSIVKSISEATQLEEKLVSNVKRKRTMQVASKKGASRWLATLPIAETGFALHKGAFRDALCLRYGGFPSICHIELRDITAGFLAEMCPMSELSHHFNHPQANILH